MKNQKGAITLITLTTVLFMIAFLVSTFTIIANRRQSQAEIKRQTKEIYGNDVEDIEEIYKEYFAEENVEIPIYTVEQLFTIEKFLLEGTSTYKYILIGDKIYKCTTDSKYKLMNNINFSVADYDYMNKDKIYFQKTGLTEEQLTAANFEYKGVAQEYKAPATGIYKLEVWGAQGGTYNVSYAQGGLGGYSVGTISLEKGTNLYVYVGGQGDYGLTAPGNYAEVNGGGYNGGGNAAYRGGAGGGASDIRFNGGIDVNWNDEKSLLSRIIVAGGGGGTYARTSSANATGGAGGGLTGLSGISGGGSLANTLMGEGGTQTSGGTGGREENSDASNFYGKNGEFGIGGDTGWKYNNMDYYSSGAGGGGWYGGGAAGNFNESVTTGGAGGRRWIRLCVDC